MRILLVNKFARVTGGADRHCLDLAEGLSQRGHEVRMLSTRSSENEWNLGAFVDAVVTSETREQLSRLAQARVFAATLWNRAAAAAARRLIDDFKPSVVHLHKLYPQLSVAPVVAATDLPVLQTLHDFEMISAGAFDATASWIDRDETARSFRALNTATFPIRRFVQRPRVDRFIAVSDAAAASYREHGIDATVLPNFTADPPPQVPGFDERSGVVFVARLDEEKGVREVLELARRAPDLGISVAGFGVLEPDVREAARRMDNLSFLGRVDAASGRQALERARVAVMPSLVREAAPLVCLEAMAVGTPVVAYPAGGLEEYVRYLGGGVVVDPSVEALSRAVRALVDDRTTWSRLSERGRGAVLARHSRSAYITRLVELYAEVKARREGR